MEPNPTSATETANRRLVLFRVLLVTGSTLVSLVIAELGARLLIPQDRSIRFEQDIDELGQLRLDQAVDMIENDPNLFWRLAPNTRIAQQHWPFFGVISNSQSLREEHEIPSTKAAGEIRVLFLGDSCTFGYGVAHDETFVAVSEELLSEHLNTPVECINAGVPGYTLFQGYRRLVSEGLNYQPDLVVLNFGWNDSSQWDHLGDREHHDILQAMTPPGVLGRSRLCELIWGHWNKPEAAGADQPTRPRLTPKEFSETLQQTHALLNEQDIPLLVLVWPMSINAAPHTSPTARTDMQSVMAEFGQAHPLASHPEVSGWLDLIPISRELVQQHGLNTIYFDHGHVNPTAHRAIGEAIARHLKAYFKGS